MELTSQRAVSRTLYSKKAVVLFLSYNEEQGSLVATEYVHELQIKDISSKGIGLLGNIFIPDKQFILIDISSDIGIIQVQAQKTYHYETRSNQKKQNSNVQTQLRIAMDLYFISKYVDTKENGRTDERFDRIEILQNIMRKEKSYFTMKLNFKSDTRYTKDLNC